MQYAFMPWPLSYSCGCLILPLIACIFCIVVVAVLSLSRKASAHFLAHSLSLWFLDSRRQYYVLLLLPFVCEESISCLVCDVWHALMNDDNTK